MDSETALVSVHECLLVHTSDSAEQVACLNKKYWS